MEQPQSEDGFDAAQAALKAAGAPVLPRKKTAEDAPMGKVWSGRKADGTVWTLTKEGPDSYVWTC